MPVAQRNRLLAKPCGAGLSALRYLLFKTALALGLGGSVLLGDFLQATVIDLA